MNKIVRNIGIAALSLGMVFTAPAIANAAQPEPATAVVSVVPAVGSSTQACGYRWVYKPNKCGFTIFVNTCDPYNREWRCDPWR